LAPPVVHPDVHVQAEEQVARATTAGLRRYSVALVGYLLRRQSAKGASPLTPAATRFPSQHNHVASQFLDLVLASLYRQTEVPHLDNRLMHFRLHASCKSSLPFS